jgi:hypothetical protein
MPESSSGSNQPQPPKVTVSADKAQVVFRIDDVVRRLLPRLSDSSSCVPCRHCSEPSENTAGPHRFEIQLETTNLSSQQLEQIGRAIRSATASELLKMDFRLTEVRSALSGYRLASSLNCGGCGSADGGVLWSR